MITQLKENVLYESFSNKDDMMEKILSIILNDKTDKILYKGDPSEINYKLMKKVLYKDYTKKIEPDTVRKEYYDIVNNMEDRSFCLIYKKH